MRTHGSFSTPTQPQSDLTSPVPYVKQTDPGKNQKLWKLLLKLDGYGAADQDKRLLLLTDQDNRTYALRYLAQHLDLLHLLDLLRSLHSLLWYRIADFGKSHGSFSWPWQWGEQPPAAQIQPLPAIAEMFWQGDPIWRRVRQVMLAHELATLDPVRCTCKKKFTSLDKWSIHSRVKVKELLDGQGRTDPPINGTGAAKAG